ncbi:hypothetical protein ES707_05713 [subsurface metagenome]
MPKKQNTPDIFSTAGQEVEEVEKEAPEKRFNLDRAIEDLAGAICDPIIVYPGGGWEKDIPKWLLEQITLDRLVEQMKATQGQEPTGTDSEALAYLFPASLCFPLGHDWTQIYLYLGAKVCGAYGKVVPEDIDIKTLDQQQDMDLRRLKGWIYEKRRQHRGLKAKDIRKERLAKEKEEELKKAPEVVQHTFDLGLEA